MTRNLPPMDSQRCGQKNRLEMAGDTIKAEQQGRPAVLVQVEGVSMLPLKTKLLSTFTLSTEQAPNEAVTASVLSAGPYVPEQATVQTPPLQTPLLSRGVPSALRAGAIQALLLGSQTPSMWRALGASSQFTLSQRLVASHESLVTRCSIAAQSSKLLASSSTIAMIRSGTTRAASLPQTKTHPKWKDSVGQPLLDWNLPDLAAQIRKSDHCSRRQGSGNQWT